LNKWTERHSLIYLSHDSTRRQLYHTWRGLSCVLCYCLKTNICRCSSMLTLTKPNLLRTVPGPHHKRKGRDLKLIKIDSDKSAMTSFASAWSSTSTTTTTTATPSALANTYLYQTGKCCSCSMVFTQRRG